jgi:hypothetical protein
MIKLIIILICLGMTLSINAQQWVDKKYTYDSSMAIVYGSSTDFMGVADTHRLNLYVPTCQDIKKSKLKPLVMFIHGGAFLGGNRNDVSINTLCRLFAQRGYVTASIDYRLGFVSDDKAWACNYPNYPCVFAADSAEWSRAYYRAVQDAKGALRFLVNRWNFFGIDTTNIFVAGESAGAFIALGVVLLDVDSERPKETYAIQSAKLPSSSSYSCSYYLSRTFSGPSVPRPDLGGIDGTIEPTTIDFTIKGIGNIYGGMLSDLLIESKPGKPKPSIYTFYQPCDIIVPADSGRVFSGLSWCFTNGYNCNAIENCTKVYGSRAICNFNRKFKHGYDILEEFSTVEFPYNFMFGDGNCIEQASKPCHAYDNFSLRETNMAKYFAGLVTTPPFCESANGIEQGENLVSIFPNPASDYIEISGSNVILSKAKNPRIYDLLDTEVTTPNLTPTLSEGEGVVRLDVSLLSPGVYFVQVGDKMYKFVKM